MTKLAVCLLKQAKDFKNFDADEVVGASKIYQSRGRAEDEANILAIEDHLRDLRTQRKAIVDHVLEQFKSKDPGRYTEIEASRKPPGPQPQAINEKEQETVIANEPAPSAVIDAAAHEAATSQENDKAQPTAAQKEAGNYAVGAIPASATAIGMPISIENPKGSIRWKLDTDRLKAIANGIIDNRHNSTEARKPALAMLDALAEITGADVTKVEGGFDRLQEAIDGLLRNFPTQQETAQEIFDAGWKNKMQQHYGYLLKTTGRDKDHVDIFLAPGAETASKVWVIDQKNKDGSFDEHKVVLGPETETEARAAYLANYAPGWDGIGAITSMPIPAFKAWVTNKSLTKKPLAYVEPEKSGAEVAPLSIEDEREINAWMDRIGVVSEVDRAGTMDIARSDLSKRQYLLDRARNAPPTLETLAPPVTDDHADERPDDAAKDVPRTDIAGEIERLKIEFPARDVDFAYARIQKEISDGATLQLNGRAWSLLNDSGRGRGFSHKRTADVGYSYKIIPLVRLEIARQAAKVGTGEMATTEDSTAVAVPAVPDKTSAAAANPRSNVVIRDVRDRDGNKLGDIIEPYDGTEEGARAAASRATDRMWSEYEDASNIQSRIGATDENGKPKWAISPNFANINPVDTVDGMATFGDEAAINDVYGATTKNSEQLPAIPEAESQAPALSESGDGGVAPAQGGKAAEHWLHDEIVNLIHFKGRTKNRKALDKIVELLKRRAAGEDVRSRAVKSYLSGFTKEPAITEILNRVVTRLEAEDKQATADKRKESNQAKKETAENGNETDQAQQGQPETPQQDAAAVAQKPKKGTVLEGVASKIVGDIYQRAVFNKFDWKRLKAYLTREIVEAGANKGQLESALESAMTEFARTANGRLGYPNANLVFKAMRDFGMIDDTQAVAQPAKQPEAPAAARRVRFISRGRTAADSFAEAVTDFKDITIPELPDRNFFIHSDGGGQTVITERETGRAMARGDTERLAYKALKDVLALRSPADIEKVIASAPVLSVDQIKDALTALENKEYAQKIADEQASDAAKSGAWDGKPSYGDKVDTQMRDGDIGAKKNKPYASRAAAVGWIFKNKASDTHEVFQVGKDQFVLRPIAGAQEAADAKKADTTHKAAVKAAEVDAFTAMAAAPELLNAETNTPDNFTVEAQRQVVKWIGAEMLAAANTGDEARVKALRSLLVDGKPLLPESFFESVRADIQKRIKQAKLDGVKDASRLALVEATVKANVTDDQDKKAFVEGWDHALDGKTKSTLPGDEIHSKGYEAARKWLKTPEGAAAFSGKRAKKLENTGADLRRWFDKQKENISGTDTDAVIAAIDAATTRTELFRSVLGEGATPGAQRWLEAFRNQVLPFKRWITEKGPLNYRFGYISRRTSDTEIIRGYLDGKIYQPKHEDDTKEQRVAVLRSAAEEYVNLIRDITENLDGRTVAELSQSLEALMMEQKDGRRQSSETGKRVRSMMLQNGRYAYWLLFGDNTAYLKDLIANEANTDQSTRKAALVPPRLDRVERNGEDFRGSQNVSPESFKRTFGFADVGFGKWVKSKQDQDHLNYSFDAFGDLAKLLGIPPEAIGLGGRLHFTIGALGHGKFAAHYSKDQPHPDGGTVPVINVTNTRGDGTVGHEFGHAFDLTPQPVADGTSAFSRTGGDSPYLARAIEEIKRDLKYAYNFDSLRAGVVGHLKGERYWNDVKAKARETDAAKIDSAVRALAYYSQPSNQRSDYYRAAIKLDGSKAGKDDAYWSNDKELFARAFEGWVGDAMETDNTYLVNPGWSGEGIITEKTHRGTPYALGAERERIAEWMDALRKSLFYDAENKVLGLDFDKWQENKPKHAEEWKQALEDLKAELPSMLEAIKREKGFAEEAAKAAREHAASMRVGDLVRPREGRESALREKIGDVPARIGVVETSGDGTVYLSLDGYGYRVRGVNLEIVQTKEQQDAQIAQAQAAEAEAPTPAAEPVGELSDAEIDALLDEAEARVKEQSQEQPDSPAPGAPVAALADTWTEDDIAFLRKKVEDGQIVLLASNELGLPTIHDMPSDKVHHMGFGVFRASTPYWEGNWTAGGEMSHTPGGHAYTTVSMTRGEIDPAIFDRDAVLNLLQKREANQQKAASELSLSNAMMDAGYSVIHNPKGSGYIVLSPGQFAVAGGATRVDAILNGEAWYAKGIENGADESIQELNARVANELLSGRRGKPPTLDEQTDRTAAKLIAKAAKQGITGIDEALKGMVKIFGGGPGKLQSFPAGLDEASYKAALPHFKAMLKAFREAGKTLVDLFELFIEEAGAGIRPYLKHFAKEMRLTADLGERASANRTIANYVLDKLSTGADIRWQDLFDVADKAFGGTQAAGTYTVKDAYDAMEMGVNLYLEKGNWNASAKTAEHAARDIRNLGRMIAQLPTQTKRTQEMDEFQQFSTPPTLAYASNWVANIRPGEVMLEPSAGTGDLAVFAHNAGANLILNELSGRRAAILKELFPRARIFTENAEQLNNVLPGDAVPTVAVMNPPFSATAGRKQGSRDSMNGAKHIEQALKRLEQGGRLVAVVGEGMAADRPAFKEWWKKIAADYNVRANIGISGKEYAKYGTTFDNQLLVIDKTGSTTNTVVTGKVETVAELPALLEGIRNDRPQAVATIHGPESVADQSEGDGDSAEGGVADGAAVGAGGNEPDAVGDGGRPSGQRPGTSKPPGVGGGRPGSNAAGNGPRKGNAATGKDGQRGSEKPDAAEGSDGSGGIPVADAGRGDGGGTGITIGNAEKQESSDLTETLFENYRPQRLAIPGAKEHPGKLIQSAAMAAVEPPAPTYTPNLPKELIDGSKPWTRYVLDNETGKFKAEKTTSAGVSLPQVEVVVYAGQAHQQTLPNGDRRGFFVGDNTGLGKGREIAAIILDNMRQGRNKAVWISANGGLINDAKRDAGSVGINPDLLFSQGKTDLGGSIQNKNGILYTTYDTMKQAEKVKDGKKVPSRLEQLAQWLGKDYDGVIAFDEAHKMGNLLPIKGKRGTTKPSDVALAGYELQKLLPNARVVYVSATGATEINNLGYSARLGLWGENTPFANAIAFVQKILTGGVAALELVSRDMKALGMYIARSLSFEGVTYRRLEHELTPLQTDIYNELAKAWQIVLQNVDAALATTGGDQNSNAKKAAMSAFWGSHQRFFNQVITSLQTPAAIEDMKRQIDAGNAIVIQLTNHHQGAADKQVGKAKAEGINLEELDLSPKQMLINYIINSFPVQAFEEQTDDNGNIIMVPVKDSDGNLVQDKEAVAMRDALLKTMDEIRVPENPIDAIINAFGSKDVGEVTGRARRYVRQRDEDGNIVLVEEPRGKNANHADAQAFQDDKKKVLIFSAAGGTGFSFHADNTAINQRKRIHYILQPGWRADAAVQGFGRTHRSNQKQPPEYVLVSTDLKAQKRFVSSIARRLDQLGAITRGDRQATNQGLFSASDNLENKYAEDAMQVFFQDLYRGDTPLVFDEVTRAMGLNNLIDPRTGGLSTSNIPEIQKFLNRLLSLQKHEQDEVFSEFEKRLEEIVAFAVQQGTYDNGMQTLKAESVKKVRDDVAYTDERTGSETRYVEVDVTNPIKYRSFENAENWSKSHGDKFVGWFKNAKGDVFGISDLGDRVNADGEVHRRGAVIDIRDHRLRYVDNLKDIKQGWAWGQQNGRSVKKTISTPVEASAIQAEWENQVAEAPKHETRREHMIVGVILPVWDRVEGHPRIYRLQTDEGERMIGRVMGPKDAAKTLKNLGLGSSVSKMAPTELLAAIKRGARAILGNGWEISTAGVSGDTRIEIKTPSGYLSGGEQSILKDQGVFFERIAFRDRAFIPTGADELKTFERVVKAKPVVDLFEKGAKPGQDGESGAMESRGDTSTDFTGHTADEIRDGLIDAFGARTIRQLEANGLIKIMENAEALQALMPGIKVSKTAKAVFIGDRAYFFANRMHPASAKIELLHEIGEHWGLERLLGEDGYSNLMQRVKSMRDTGQKQLDARREGDNSQFTDEELAAGAWNFVVRNYPEEAEGSKRFMHEVLAQLGQNADIQARPWWKQIIEKVKRALVRMGFTGMIKVSDIEDMVLHSLMVAARKPDGGPRGGIRGSETANTSMASEGKKLADDLAAQESWLKARAAERGFDGIEDFLAGDYNGFAEVAAEWREEHPAEGLYARGPAYGPVDINSPEFKAWFKKSAVSTGAKGKPRMVYHGSQRDIEVFKGNAYAGFFAINPDLFNRYTRGDNSEAVDSEQNDGVVYPAFLSTQKPANLTSFDMNSQFARYGSGEEAKWVDELGVPRDVIDDAVDYAKEKGMFFGYPKNWNIVNTPPFKAWIESLGYDGIVAREGGVKVWAVMRPEQIKSAISNTGEFSSTDPRIQYSKAGNYLDDLKAGVASTLNNAEYAPRDKAEAPLSSPDVWFKPVLNAMGSALKGSNTFGPLDRSIHSQLHKAQKNRYFGEVFKRLQHFMADASRAALRPAELAPTVLPRIDVATNAMGALRSLLKGKAASADIDAAFNSALRGTLDDRVYATAAEADLTDDQFRIYHEIRDSVDASLDELSAAEAWGIARTIFLNAAGKLTRAGLTMKKDILENPDQAKEVLIGRLTTMLEDLGLRANELTGLAREAAPFIGSTEDSRNDLKIAMQSGLGNQVQNAAIARALEAFTEIAAVKDTIEKTGKVFERRDQLQKEGYVPLMRFGQHYLTITRVDPMTGEAEIDEHGDKVTEYFSLFESASERDKAEKTMREEFADASVEFDSGTMSEEEWSRYKGVSPESVALFAGKLGIGTDDVFQEWYRLAASNRSTLKRLIHRKGTPGFSEDGSRVMAAFLTSNGRRASMLYHMADVQEAIEGFPRQQGAEKDEAIKLVEYIQNPDEEASAPRALMFMHFLGGSISNFFINASQPAMVTLPYISQFVGMPRAMALLKEAYSLRGHPEAMSQELRDALAKADQEGKVGAQEIHHLWQETARPLISKMGRFGEGAVYRANAFMQLWGMPFAVAELMNRQVTFISAYNAAKEQGGTPAQAYSKAILAVDETQFVYCVDKETEVLTKYGWMRHDEVKRGMVAMAVAENGNLVESMIGGVHRFDGDQRITEFRNQEGFSMAVTSGHDCVIQCYNSRDKKWQSVRKVKAADIAQSHHLLRVPLGNSVERKEVYSDDEIRLFAWVAAEGSLHALRGCKEKKQVRLVQSPTHNPHYVAEIDALLDRLGGHFSRYHYPDNKNKMVQWVLRKPLWSKIHEALPGKLITGKLIAGMSIRQMSIFLDVFGKGDGCMNESGGWMISQKSAQNLDCLQAMSVMCGISSSLDYFGKGESCGSVYLGTNNKRTAVKFLTREDRIVDGVWCPETEHGTWIARRNGRTFVTGNSKQNRPNWARGTLGSLIFTFRLFSISYTELLVRMLRGSPESRKAGLYMLGTLFLAAGAQGMPGADDLDDLIDTIAQMLGYNVSSKLSKRKFVENLAGKEVSEFVMHGLSALSPLDVSGRMSLGNLLPGTGLLKPSNTRKESDLLEIIGPIGGLSMSYINTSDAVSTGNWNRASTEWMPKALKDLARGAEMATSGEARDGRGNKITDINPLEALVKSIGFNPQSIAELGRNTRDVQQTISFARRNESIIAEKWARGIVEGNQGDIQAARNEVVEWNATNPDTPIDVKYSSVARRVAAMRSTKKERFVKAATKGMREYAKESIE